MASMQNLLIFSEFAEVLFLSQENLFKKKKTKGALIGFADLSQPISKGDRSVAPTHSLVRTYKRIALRSLE